MNNPYAQTLRQLRRSAALTQNDVARILVRDTILLSMLFGASEPEVFPHLYLTTKDLFQSNLRQVIEEALAEGEPVNSDRLRFLRDALTNTAISENIVTNDL